MVTLSIILAVLVAAAVFFVLFRADRNRNIRMPWLPAGLKALIAFLCMLLILAPKVNRHIVEEQKPLILFIQDNSASVQQELGKNKEAYATQQKTFLDKLSKNFRVITWDLDGPEAADSLRDYTAQSTNLSKPLEEAVSQFYNQNLSAVILASDGNYNAGSNPSYTSFPVNSFVYTIAIGDSSKKPDLRIGRIYANKTVSLNSEWELRADILAENLPNRDIKVSLKDETGRELARTLVRSNAPQFDKQIAFLLKADKEGLHQYTVHAEPFNEEANTANNRNVAFVQVLSEKKKILLAYAAPHPDIKAISSALAGHKQYELELRESSELPASLDGYAAVILHQLPSNTKSIAPALLNGKNVWFITGSLNNYFETGKLQHIVRFVAGMGNITPEVKLNQSFNLFTLPADLPAVTDELPPLSISARDLSISGGAQALFSDPQGRPLWAIQPGNPAIAVTSGEGIWRWRLYEYKHFGKQDAIDDCILQTLNLLTNAGNTKRFRAEPAKYNWSSSEQVRLSAWLTNPAGELINTPQADLQLKDSSGKARSYRFEKNNNRYQLNIGALAPGAYSYTASVTTDGKAFSDAGRFFVGQTSIEQMSSGCNYPLLASLAQKNRGIAVFADQLPQLYDSVSKNKMIRPLLSERLEPVSLIDWKWIFFLILILAAVDWFLRKYWMAM
ncbi:hypothetical protein [Rurimicrobium arvi]|uniref:VWA domain-containing protein n=1 Tax=Rurimicrobium arvi TaxID=2049916 RepID=A0ABP8N324_9BACT